MGILSLFQRFRKQQSRDLRILLLGLDNAGKTTILKRVAEEDVVHVTPTQGFNIKTVEQEGVKLNVWDIGGAKAIRMYWRNYFESTDILIYVIDSSDRQRMEETAETFSDLLQESKLIGVPLLVFANKQDLPNALDADAIAASLNLTNIRDRTWNIQGTSAKDGTGITEGLEWAIGKAGKK